jgi:DNA-directed RNA polymerase beta' subunit
MTSFLLLCFCYYYVFLYLRIILFRLLLFLIVSVAHSSCVTCGLSNFACPGHFGYIDLLVPQYNKFLFSDLKMFLSSICYVCNKFLLRANVVCSDSFIDLFL